ATVERALAPSDGERVKLAAGAVDGDEGQGACVRAVCEQDKDALTTRIYPATRAGEAEMTEAVGRERRARCRVRRCGELPSERARFVEAGGHVGAKERAGVGFKQTCARGDELCGEGAGFARG